MSLIDGLRLLDLLDVPHELQKGLWVFLEVLSFFQVSVKDGNLNSRAFTAKRCSFLWKVSANSFTASHFLNVSMTLSDISELSLINLHKMHIYWEYLFRK